MAQTVRFEGVLTPTSRDRALLATPDPEPLWGARPLYRVGGHANGEKFRGQIERIEGAWALVLTRMWLRDAGLEVGDRVRIEMYIEGPQRGDLDPDLAESLGAEPEAAAFWDTLAQFYRKAYLTWIAGTKRRPDERARRIAETVRLLKAGVKARP